MTSRWKAIIVSASLLGLMSSAAAAFQAYVPQNTNMRWGPSTDFPAMVTVPAGSYVEVADCSEEWCNTIWGEYEGFIYRPLLAIAGTVTVPYVAAYPDYEYYQGYYYGPTFVFQYHGGKFHSRRSSRAVMHSRAESRAVHHSRADSRASHRRGDSLASHHSRSDSRAAYTKRREIGPEALRRQSEQQRLETLRQRREQTEIRRDRIEQRRREDLDRRPVTRQQIERRAPLAEQQRAIRQRPQPGAERQRIERPAMQRQRAAPQREARPPQVLQQRTAQRQLRPPQVRQQREARPARELRQRAVPQARQERSRPSGGNLERRRRD